MEFNNEQYWIILIKVNVSAKAEEISVDLYLRSTFLTIDNKAK